MTGLRQTITETCAFLGANAASFVTGRIMPVDGGWDGARFFASAPIHGLNSEPFCLNRCIHFCLNRCIHLGGER